MRLPISSPSSKGLPPNVAAEDQAPGPALHAERSFLQQILVAHLAVGE
jgi:hypothetical protein